MTDHITGGEAVYRVLKANGIDTVFGLLGGSMMELYDAIHVGGEIAYVGARDERAAGHMADAWARMTGKPGVVLGAQAGPGRREGGRRGDGGLADPALAGEQEHAHRGQAFSARALMAFRESLTTLVAMRRRTMPGSGTVETTSSS